MMDYKYFKHIYSDLDPINLKPVHEVVGLYRTNESLNAEMYKGSGNWEPDKSGFVVEAILGIDWVTEYDEISKSEAKKLKQDLFPKVHSSY